MLEVCLCNYGIYIDKQIYEKYTVELIQIGKMLNKLHQNWKSK